MSLLKIRHFLKNINFHIIIFNIDNLYFHLSQEDINLALSLSSALLISKITINCYEKGKKNFKNFINIVYPPSILYASTGFSCIHNSTQLKITLNEYKVKLKNK